MDDGVYKIQNLDDVEIKKIDDVDAGYRYIHLGAATSSTCSNPLLNVN